jgi:hypothetical protein
MAFVSEPSVKVSDKHLRILFWLVAVATIVPIWAGRYLPLLDIPNHLSAIAVWHYYDDPRFDFSQWYTLNLAPLPYWGHYYFCHIVAYVTGVEVANKVYLTAYALALPLGVRALARRFERSPWLAFFAFPVVWNFNIAEGFLAFAGGLAVAIWALVLLDIHCEKPRGWTALAVLAAGAGVYAFHLLPYLFFLTAGGLLVFAQRRQIDPLMVVARGIPLLAAAAIGLYAYRHESQYGFQKLEGRRDFIVDPLWRILAWIPERLLNFSSSSRDEWVLLILAGSWLLLALTQARQPRRPTEGVRDLRLEVCLSALVILYLGLPRSMQRPFYWYMINQRYVPLLLLLGVLLLRRPIEGSRRWLLLVVAGASIFYAADITRTVIRFNHKMADFDKVVAAIPLHKSTLTLSLRPLGDPDVNVGVYNQLPSYTQLRAGGYNFYNFNQGFPLKYKTRKPAPPWDHAEMFDWSTQGFAWDYFLTHNESTSERTPGDAPPVDLFSSLVAAGKVRLVTSVGAFRLYERIP